MKKTIAAVLAVCAVSCIVFSGCTGAAKDDKTTTAPVNAKYGENDEGAAMWGPVIIYNGSNYLLQPSVSKLPANAVYLGESSDESTQMIGGEKVACVSNLIDNSEEVYIVNIDPHSAYYISADKKTIYRQKDKTYDVFAIEAN